jgi:hypothetical protein
MIAFRRRAACGLILGRGDDKTPIAVRAEALSEVWWLGRQWAVTFPIAMTRHGALISPAPP